MSPQVHPLSHLQAHENIDLRSLIRRLTTTGLVEVRCVYSGNTWAWDILEVPSEPMSFPIIRSLTHSDTLI